MENAKKCSVYIDESGDLGFNRGTRWFVLTGVIVDADKESEIIKKLKSIKNRLNIQTIHFRNIRSFEKRCFIVNEIADCDFQYVNIIIDTTDITFSKRIDKTDNMPESAIIYNYACRMLLERVSWLLRDTNRVGCIVLSSRGTNRDGELIDYITKKLLPSENNSIANCFTSVTSKPFSQWEMLQIPDICATSMFYCYEPNSFGFITPCFNKRLVKHLYVRNGRLMRYGIKYYSDSMIVGKEYFDSHKICK